MSEQHGTSDARFTDGGLAGCRQLEKDGPDIQEYISWSSFPDQRDSFWSPKSSDVFSIGKPNNQLSTRQAFPATSSVILNDGEDHFWMNQENQRKPREFIHSSTYL